MVETKIRSMPKTFEQKERRAAEVYRKTWALVAEELGGSMPAYLFHRPGDGVVPPVRGAAMWADRTAGIDTIHVMPAYVSELASIYPSKRRASQKMLFHEFRHARQSEELRRDIAARELDASQFARSRALMYLRPRR